MAVVIDKIQGVPFLHDHPIKTVTSDPASGKDGNLILNTSSNQIKVWYYDGWQVLHTLQYPDILLMETGDNLLLETGDKIFIETGVVADVYDNILMETGDNLLMETGDILLID